MALKRTTLRRAQCGLRLPRLFLSQRRWKVARQTALLAITTLSTTSRRRSPLIRGKHTIQTGAQFEYGYDNYFQTNIASGAFAFGGNWTTSTGGAGLVTNPNLHSPTSCSACRKIKEASSIRPKGVAQVPAQTRACKCTEPYTRTTRGNLTPKLTLNLGLRMNCRAHGLNAYGRLSYGIRRQPMPRYPAVSGLAQLARAGCVPCRNWPQLQQEQHPNGQESVSLRGWASPTPWIRKPWFGGLWHLLTFRTTCRSDSTPTMTL